MVNLKRKAGSFFVMLGLTLSLATVACASYQFTGAGPASTAGHVFSFGGHISYVQVPMQFKVMAGTATGNTSHNYNVNGPCVAPVCGVGQGTVAYMACGDDAKPFTGGSYSHDVEPMLTREKTGDPASPHVLASGTKFTHTHWGNGIYEEENLNNGTLDASESYPTKPSGWTYYYKLKFWDNASPSNQVTSRQAALPQ